MALPTERPRLLGLRSHGHGCPLLLERACGSLHLGNVEGKRLPLKTLWGQVENQMEQSLRGALGVTKTPASPGCRAVGAWC